MDVNIELERRIQKFLDVQLMLVHAVGHVRHSRYQRVAGLRRHDDNNDS